MVILIHIVSPVIIVTLSLVPLGSSEDHLGPCPRPLDFPSGIPLHITKYESHSYEIKVPFAYIATPEFPEDIPVIANWALDHGYRVRALGNRHNWSPFLFALSEANSSYCPKVILVDTTKHFTSMKVNPHDSGRPDLNSVTVGTGVTLLNLLTFLEKNNLGLFQAPAMGPVTVGGMLAVGAHGSGIPSPVPLSLDKKFTGHSYGSMSNLIIEMTLVAWNQNISSYMLKTLHRSDKDCKAFLTHLGRSFVTSVKLRVGPNQMLRTQSHFFIPSKELFATGNKNDLRTVTKFAMKYGRVNVIETSYAPYCWVMTWHNEPVKPDQSKNTTGPMNYYFMNNFPKFVENNLRSLLFGVPASTKIVGRLLYPYVIVGSQLSRSMDYWGPSKNHLLYMSPKILRLSDQSFAIVTSPENLQWVVSSIKSNYDMLLEKYAKMDQYPINGEFDIRISGVDDPKDIEVPGAEAPSLSAASPSPEYPEFTLVVWVQISGLFGTPSMNEMMTEFESNLYLELHETFAIVRPEWAKGWGFTQMGPWRNKTVLREYYPRAFSSSDKLEEWNWAVSTLNRYDPHGIFSNEFLDSVLSVYDKK